MGNMEKIEKGLHNLIIDKEIASVFPPRTSKDEETLVMQLRTEGCRDDLITWQGIIIDGHTRYRICHEYNIPFSYREMSFPSKERAKLWMIENQVARRNLSVFQRCVIALPFERAYKEEAEERRREKISEYRKNSETPQNSAASKETRDALADLVGTSHDTIDKVKYILKNGSDELKAEVSRGNISIHKAFTSLKPKKDSKEKAELKSNDLADVSEATEATEATELTEKDDVTVPTEEFDECDITDNSDDSSDSSDSSDWWDSVRCSGTNREYVPEPESELIGGNKTIVHLDKPIETYSHEPERTPSEFYYVKDQVRFAIQAMLKELKVGIYQLKTEDFDKRDELLAIVEDGCKQAKQLINEETGRK